MPVEDGVQFPGAPDGGMGLAAATPTATATATVGGGEGSLQFLWPEVAPSAFYLGGHGLLKCQFDSPKHGGSGELFVASVVPIVRTFALGLCFMSPAKAGQRAQESRGSSSV